MERNPNTVTCSSRSTKHRISIHVFHVSLSPYVGGKEIFIALDFIVWGSYCFVVVLTLTVLVTTIDALWHFETG